MLQMSRSTEAAAAVKDICSPDCRTYVAEAMRSGMQRQHKTLPRVQAILQCHSRMLDVEWGRFPGEFLDQVRDLVNLD
jgi:hypothetical protein